MSTYCSCRGPGSNTQYPKLTTACISSSNALFWTLQDTCTHVHIPTEMHTVLGTSGFCRKVTSGNFVLCPRDAVQTRNNDPWTFSQCLRTFRLCDVNQSAEDLAHAWLQSEVFGTTSHRNDQVGCFEVPVLGQQFVQGFGVCVTG